MGLREQLMDDLKDAMRQQDAVRKRGIRSVITAIKRAEAELDESGQRVRLNDEDILALIEGLAKQRGQSIFEFGKGGRQDLVAEEEAELAILQTYLPRRLTRSEIEAEAQLVIEEVGANSPRDVGKVMRPLMARLDKRADGRLVNQVVRELLAG
ncbi:GatB/YqeY domain-containing protein [Chloroflexota bacterium]